VRIVFLTQVVDTEHPALAQTVDKIRALAARSERVGVVTDRVGAHDLPGNVAFRTFGSATRAGRGARFVAAVAAELRPRPDLVLAHMVPQYVLLAAPLAKPLRVPLALWYTHWHASAALRAAERLADVVLSVSAGSFPLATPKLLPTGHAIDVERFEPGDEREPGTRLRLLALGRTARWKGYDTMLSGLERAVAQGVDAELEIRGPQLTDDERAHAAELRERIGASPSLRERVRIEPPLPRGELPALLRRADALLSATQPRSSETLDKVVYEAAATGVPVLASNTALADFLAGLPLELSFAAGDAEGLAERLAALAAADAATRRETGLALRARVVEGHSVGHWADAVARLVARQAPE
jgi:glycosyltransferase involved in cell wall biosynthesis